MLQHVAKVFPVRTLATTSGTSSWAWMACACQESRMRCYRGRGMEVTSHVGHRLLQGAPKRLAELSCHNPRRRRPKHGQNLRLGLMMVAAPRPSLPDLSTHDTESPHVMSSCNAVMSCRHAVMSCFAHLPATSVSHGPRRFAWAIWGGHRITTPPGPGCVLNHDMSGGCIVRSLGSLACADCSCRNSSDGLITALPCTD